MENKFRYKLDKRCRYFTVLTILCAAALFATLYFSGAGGYLPAWFVSVALALVALCTLSVPRFVRTTDQAVEIHCLVEITVVPYDEIRTVRPVAREEIRRILPLLGAHGFFGYFGYYVDLNNWDIVKVYASSWDRLVMIEDIYEQRYLVSAERTTELCKAIEQGRLRRGSAETAVRI